MGAYLLIRARALLVTLWAGSLWTVGYLAAPLFLATLPDRMLAGTIAGSLFRAEAWLSLICGALLLLMFGADRNRPARFACTKLILAMLSCVIIGHFGVQPYMAEMRAAAVQAGGVMDEAMRSRFGVLHGVASIFYLLQSLLAVALVLRSRQD